MGSRPRSISIVFLCTVNSVQAFTGNVLVVFRGLTSLSILGSYVMTRVSVLFGIEKGAFNRD